MTMYVVNLVLLFFSRRTFLNYLGIEILGLNSTVTNMLQFLNLAEMGVWGAIASSLYIPLFNKDYYTISQIISFNGRIYRRIGLSIIGASLILMMFFPLIFNKSGVPLIYAYASFSVMLFSSLLGYFVNYKQFLLAADQQNYKIQYTYKLSMSLKILAQILALSLLPHPYLWWLILEFVFAIVASVSLSYIVKRTYPFLKDTGESYSTLKQKFPHIVKRVKQLFIQKISGFVLFQTSPLIIYGLASLSLVTLYDNYMLIINGVISLMAAGFNGMLGGIGNLVASSSKDHIMNVFKQLYILRFFIISVLSFGIMNCGQAFVSLWIGKEYILPQSTLLLMTVTFFIYVNRYVVFDFLTAYGYFGDVWASIAEVVVNISCSIILGKILGLNGVLLGVLISLILISLVWKPIYLFKIKLKMGLRSFWQANILGGGGLIVASAIIYILKYPVNPSFTSSWGRLSFNILQTIVFSLILFLYFFILSDSFKTVIKRFYPVKSKL